MDLAVLIVRVVLGLVVAAHGAQKLFGWFGGAGLSGVTGWLASMGLRPARLWAVLAGLVELGAVSSSPSACCRRSDRSGSRPPC